jgi:alkanesulfonate monooxygenase SsuD/methylene tetrahydromethanopterin reductase-like flavin-dependent oxidoreductase (luciferase family)
LALGIGPSHASVIENMHGLHYDRPALHTREYLQILRNAFAGTGSSRATASSSTSRRCSQCPASASRCC